MSVYYNINIQRSKKLILMLCLSILNRYNFFRLMTPSNWRMNKRSDTVRKHSFTYKVPVSHIERFI